MYFLEGYQDLEELSILSRSRLKIGDGIKELHSLDAIEMTKSSKGNYRGQVMMLKHWNQIISYYHHHYELMIQGN